MNLPNKITSLRLILVFLGLGILVFPYHLVIDGPIHVYPLFGTEVNAVYLIVGIMFIVASFTDFLDGYLARKLNLVTNLGKFLDPVADKVLTNGALIALMLRPEWIDYTHLTIPLWAVLIMVIRDLIIDALRMIAVEQKKVIAANLYGKVKTFFQMITIILVFFNNPFFSSLLMPLGFSITEIFIYISSGLSLVSLVVYLKENRHVLHQNNH
jgi:CDP-diacylglycerol--glycerol-3-phosphate 3-phosphatidyltransferase